METSTGLKLKFPLKPEELAQYNDDLRPQYYVGIAICTACVVIALVLRLYAQFLIKSLNKTDNWLAVVAGVSIVRHSLSLRGV